MSHMAEIDCERRQGIKLTHHECHDEVKRWVCTTCLASAEDKAKVVHEAGCLNAPGASKTVIVIYPRDTPWTQDKWADKREYPYDVPVGMSDLEVCELIFRQWNHVNGDEFISEMGIEERSFSVGDMVKFPDGKHYICKGCGFKELNQAEVETNLNLTMRGRMLNF